MTIYSKPFPVEVREQFESGRAQENSIAFVAPNYSIFFFAVLAISFLAIASMFGAGMIAKGWSLFQVEPDASIAGPIIAMLIGLTFAGLGCWFFWQLVNAIKRKKIDREMGFHSGFRLDDYALSVLYHTYWDREVAIYLKKGEIEKAKMRTEIVFRGQGPSNKGKIYRFFVDIFDVTGQRIEIPAKYFRPTKMQKLDTDGPTTFDTNELAAMTLVRLINEWLQE